MHLRNGTIHRHAPRLTADQACAFGQVRWLIEMRIFDRRVQRNFFLQQQFNAFDVFIGMETLNHHIAQ